MAKILAKAFDVPARSSPPPALTRRQRQIMDAVYKLGSATVAQIAGQLPEPPTPGAMRTLLKILEEKGLLARGYEGHRLLYRPRRPKAEASVGMLRHVVDTFFSGSPERAMSTLLDSVAAARLTDDDVDRLSALIAEARARQRKQRDGE